MALTGNLHDFDLSYIFQIISQEGKTGRLMLSSGSEQAHAIFEKGKIISAGIGAKDMKKALMIYLVDIKKAPYSFIRGVADQSKDDIAAFTQQCINLKYISEDEIRRLAESILEDLACELFLWKEGTYQFDQIKSAEKYRINQVAASSDAITMEAARRIDEWARLKKTIKPSTVFVAASPANSDFPASDALRDPSEYLYSLIDGSISVEYICKVSFLSTYRVYETLASLLQDDRIIALSEKLSSTINEALQREIKAKPFSTGDIAIASAITFLLIALTFLISAMVPHSIMNSYKDTAERTYCSDIEAGLIDEKTVPARLYYYAKKGSEPRDNKDLVQENILSPRDVPANTALDSRLR